MKGSAPGQRDGAEGVPLARLEALADVEIDLVDLQDARGRVDRDREEHADRHHHHLGHLAEPEDQQDERQQRALRDREGRGDQRIDQRAHRPRDAHADADDHRRDAAEQEPERDPLQADRHMLDQFAGAGELDEHADDRGRRREEPHVDEPEAGGELPGQQQSERRADAHQPLAAPRGKSLHLADVSDLGGLRRGGTLCCATARSCAVIPGSPCLRS